MSAPFNTIHHGDCLDVLPTLAPASVNFVLTDPPYVARYRPRDGRRVLNDDNDAWLNPAFSELYRVLAPDCFCISFYAMSQADIFMAAFRAAGFRTLGHFAFVKPYDAGQKYVRYQHECAYLLAKGRPKVPERTIADVLEWDYTGNKLHPTQKPLSVLLPLVETFSAPGGLVLDPFAGSGSSLLAARQLGRSYLGIELDARYHAVASRRLEQAAPVPAASLPMGTAVA